MLLRFYLDFTRNLGLSRALGATRGVLVGVLVDVVHPGDEATAAAKSKLLRASLSPSKL